MPDINSGNPKVSDRVTTSPLWFRVATVLLAAAIFVADTATDFEVSVSVLYVIVVLMASRFLHRRGTVYVAVACVGLAVVSAILTPPQGKAFTGVANTLISVAAIAVTTFLVLHSQARELLLREQIEERKRAEEGLRASEGRFRMLVDHAADLILLRTEDGKLVDVNQHACEKLGYTRDELIGMTPRDIVDPNEDPAHFRSVGERLNAGEVFSFESGFRRKDGSVFPAEVRVRPFSQGSQRFFLAIARDITERKQAEEKIRQQEIEQRQVLEFAPQLVAVFGPDRERLYANRPSLDYLGLSLEEWQAISDPLWFFHPDDRERLTKDVYTEERSDVPHEFEARFRGKDGTHRWFLFRDNPLRDEQGRIQRWYLSATDIEDRKRAEEQLRSTADELQRVMASISDCLWSAEIDENWKWTYRHYSPAVEKITGRPPSFFVHDPATWIGLVHPDDREQILKDFQLLASGQSEREEGEYRILRPDGEIRWVRDSATVTRSGQRLRIDGVVSDITDRKRAEQERNKLHELEATLAHINRVSVMGEMTASIAHEINQPLSGVVSNGSACLRWLSGEPPNLEEAREAARRIVRDGKRAGEIIARVRALVRKTAAPRTKLDLNETIKEIISLVTDEAKKRRITVRTEFADDLAPVLGDRVQLQQVVLNIVMNAMDAMTDTASRLLVIVTQSDSAGQVQVAVRDTGAGFDPDATEKIFEPFYSTKSDGMGMGLSISRSIIQSHGGRLSVAANEGAGVTVQFTIPEFKVGASLDRT